MRKDYIFDEYRYAKQLLYSHDDFKPNQQELNLLACYYLKSNDDNEYIKSKLNSFIRKKIATSVKAINDFDKNHVAWDKKVVMAIRYAKSIGFKKNKFVSFSKKEMDTILGQKTIKLQNLLFVLSVLAKFNRVDLPDHRKKYAIYDYFRITQSEDTLKDLCQVKTVKYDFEKLLNSGILRKSRVGYELDFLENVDSGFKVECNDKLIQQLNVYVKSRV